MYLHGRGKIPYFMNGFLHEVLDLIPAIILPILFCKVNILLLLGGLPPKLFHISLWNGNRQNKLI
jgi:E3 ubiquitin-protein ligase DOA10